MFAETPHVRADGAKAVLHVSGTTPFALGHYPEDPIYPGVLSLGCMQALATEYVQRLKRFDMEPTGIKRVSYLAQIRPGDKLDVSCDEAKPKGDSLIVKSRVMRGA